MTPCLQQALFGQGARRDQTHDIALHHRLRPPLLCFGRVFHLFAHRHAKALADQRQQISLGGMHRHPAHCDIFSKMLAPFRQRDIQRLGCRYGIVEKKFVKIAHPIEQESIGILPLDLQVLRHHRRHGWLLRRHDFPRSYFARPYKRRVAGETQFSPLLSRRQTPGKDQPTLR